MANIIDSLGARFFAEKFVDAMFVHDNAPYAVVDADAECLTARNLKTGRNTQLNKEIFKGFKNFAYPALGYRRLAPNLVGYAIKEQSARRGLAADRVRITFSPFTEFMLKGLLVKKCGTREKSIALILPEYDKPADLADLLNLKKSQLVLDENLLIEPATDNPDGWMSIYYNTVKVGGIDKQGTRTYVSTKYKHLIEKQLEA